jgi:DNA repair protein RadC
MSEGSIDQSAIYVREVVRRALVLGSAAVIIAHNHPSGDPTPSRQDIAITRDLANALKSIGIVLHDHVIIARDGHVSFRTKGLL